MRSRSGIMRIMRLNSRSLFLSCYSMGRCLSSTPRLIMANNMYTGRLIQRYLSNYLLSSRRRCIRLVRFYSSEGDGENKTETQFAAEELPELSARGARFRDQFLSMIVPWEKIADVSLDTFPYYIPEGNKTHLLECMASHLKGNKVRKYGRRLGSASNRILLRSIPGTGKYRERLVSALAREFQAPLLKLDSSSFPPYDFISEGKPDEGNSESDDDEEDYSTDDESGDDTDDEKDTVRPLRKGNSEVHWTDDFDQRSEQQVLKEHNLICVDLENANINDKILTREEAKEIIGRATNNCLSSCSLPCVKDGRLEVPHESIKLAISRLKEKETESENPSKKLRDLASDSYEKTFTSAVVCPADINVKFDDVGALEHVKRELFELAILPLRRPELFSHGNLLRPCKGMLLFGPPGTGKTLIAKALATEAGANFISISPASLASMWDGESEHLTRALFSYASKLAPVVIFVDEVDALLGARGNREHEATRKMRNEFMAAWDGLSSQESQRILVLGATNRPFDLDDAVIRRMPRRIYVGLPDVANRSKILKVILAKENLEPGFSFEQLAEATEGYSGSDLKNLCAAAAYIPVQETLEKESKGEKSDGVPVIRPLNVDDFIHSTAKVKPSVAYNSRSIKELREWSEQYSEGENRA